MKILIDIGHPAHVHLFKNLSGELKKRGHEVYYSVRDIHVAKRLMDYYAMTPYLNLGSKKDSLIGKAQVVIKQDVLLYRFVRQNKINIGISSGLALSHVSKMTTLKSIMFDDDDDSVEPLIVRYGHPLTDVVYTPDCIHRHTKRSVYYAGTHELAYLHPKRFTPNMLVLNKAGVQLGERFSVMRFVAFKGHHDVGHAGISLEQKRRLVDLLSRHGRVIITSERQIEPEFEQYRLPVPPEEIHSLLYYSSLFVGDSQTMTSEAAILGVPSLKCNTFAGKLSVPNELEQKYGLCYAYQPYDFDKLIDKAKKLLENTNSKAQWQARRQRFLNDKIDVTAFFTWFIENYPESQKIMRENPDYQYRFK